MTATNNIKLPHLRRAGNGWELVVDDKPYLILGAELQNSSMSSARHMDTVWQKLKDMNINTVLGNVCWEDIERNEDQFDFSELDKILVAARSYGFRVILLWFGSFKNGMSSYVPSWVKTNPRRFPRMQCRQSNGSLVPSSNISVFHEECVQADAKAFTKLMQHLGERDLEHTVIMVQVQNEVGLLGDSRDASFTAENIFRSPVPPELVNFLATQWDSLLPDLKHSFPVFSRSIPQLLQHQQPGSWEECFGSSVYTDELFMAYHYCLYVEKIAAAGKQAHRIPLFTNVWLPKPGIGAGLGNAIAAGGNLPGEYPSGGPTCTVLDVWLRFAPTLDLIAPDIYSADYTVTCQAYSRSGQPLLIPEQRRDDYGARRLWEALGTHGALGACPFGIDTIEAQSSPYTKHYRLLNSVQSIIITARQGALRTIGFFFDEFEGDGADNTPPKRLAFTHYDLFVSRAFVLGRPGPGHGMIIELEPARYLLIGEGFKVEFKSTSRTSAFTGIIHFEEKSVDPASGSLRTERRLNGDETRSGKWANMPVENPDYGEGFIPLTVPAGTMIAEVMVYSLEQEDIIN
ncbi:hypothetical protein FOQG_17251 [Fusarium oxysporum f. sp. raphani 54005]|uniref:Beta-galactosidase n=2 Tax=Fusarium oxysporum f. sp. raphani TaxID=96318 RepID=X0B7D4_FUSOX|nr:hypothetical protein FOQG_17251 [Fusarium oxysporum f. sp. raphani 54005]KAG7408066.1 hypothetical protein Forpi1262_v018004 [Fusarium oxysporum f. sp. raphani]